MHRLCLLVFVALLLSLESRGADQKLVQAAVMSAAEANQAAAADERFVYAIDSAVIAKYDRTSGKRLAVSAGSAKHLNSGFLHDGKLYCAHSNYPQKPEKSEVMTLE